MWCPCCLWVFEAEMKGVFFKMFDLFFSCSNLPDLCSDRALELSGSFWARRQFKTLSHSLCQISSTSKKPFMNQFSLNNYAGIIWRIIMSNKHIQENFNLFTDFTIYKLNTKTLLIPFFSFWTKQHAQFTISTNMVYIKQNSY